MKLGVCVPYRNREEHLKEFIPKVSEYLTNAGIEHEFYIAHQVDEKLFNRGTMKNIAAEHAFDDGCDYIVWHDVDMIPEEGGGADYSFPEEGPRHIATKISQMNYKLKYYEYFGGAVVFSKEQVEKTNGYSNNYWDWGMEDDDLFWRCYLEGLTDNRYLELKVKNQSFVHFDGQESYVRIPFQKELRSLTARDHTISVLVRAEQQPDKYPIYLIGDSKKKYVEYPVFRIPGYDYGISFNNSRAYSLMYWDVFNKLYYMWAKRYERQWTWVTATFNSFDCVSKLYINGEEVSEELGLGSKSPLNWGNKRLKTYKNYDWYLGVSPGMHPSKTEKFFKGDIGKVFCWDTVLTDSEIKELHNSVPNENLLLNVDFNKREAKKRVEVYHAQIKKEKIKIPKSILPHRVEGKMFCLPHKDEGIVGGEFVKGKTTAKNEKRYILEMQNGKVNYKKDGMNSLEYEIVSIEHLAENAKMINVKL